MDLVKFMDANARYCCFQQHDIRASSAEGSNPAHDQGYAMSKLTAEEASAKVKEEIAQMVAGDETAAARASYFASVRGNQIFPKFKSDK
jgi:hypothetical protein